MRTFWDLEEKERAGLTSEEVERFLDAELMTKGVLKVAPLVLDQEPEITEPTMATYYQVGPCAFADAAQAEAFLKLGPVTVESKYLGGGYRNYLVVAAPIESVINEKRLCEERDFDQRKSDLDRRAAVRDSNEKRAATHREESEAQNKVLAGVWEDWHRCREVDAKHRRVVGTFAEYVRVAGSAFTAARFLEKVFSVSEIREAAEWCEEEIPDPRVTDAEERVEASHKITVPPSRPAADEAAMLF